MQRYSKRKINRLIIFSLLFIMSIMVISYAAFSSKINIAGTSSITSSWDIKIISAEVTEINGTAENVKNTYNDLSASLEANLINKGDYVEYSIIVQNNGDFDAKLENIGLTTSDNEAVLITTSGLINGEVLYKQTSKVLKVKIMYNPDYEGEAVGTSAEGTIDLNFVQNSGGTVVPTEDYLVTYDLNGGEKSNAKDEYIAEGESVNLSYTATKAGYDFMGWNTDKEATEGLKELIMGTNDITLYAIFKIIDTTAPIINDINTSVTTHSILVNVDASDSESKITKYEFKINDNEWIDNGSNSSYTFENLDKNTGYNISVRVTNEKGLQTEKELTNKIDINDNLVTSGDGLYTDPYTADRYIYRGSNPNNHVIFNNELWRIIALEPDGTYQIIRDTFLGEMPWSTEDSNVWTLPVSLNTYLNNEYYNSLTDKDDITSHNFNIGSSTQDNDDLASQFTEEKNSVWNGKVGLMTASDYINANSNTVDCNSFLKLTNNRDLCSATNYLLKGETAWTITAKKGSSSSVYAVSGSSSRLYNEDNGVDYSTVQPVVYLKNDTEIKIGDGTLNNPFRLNKDIFTASFEAPTFIESDTKLGEVTIVYPKGANFTYEYKINDGEFTNASQTEVINVTENSEITARVSDGNETLTSTYSLILTTSLAGQTINLVKTGDGLYKDKNISNRYVYRGTSPNNYLKFNNELWRIIAKEPDGTYKIIRNDSIGQNSFDDASNNWESSTLNSYLNNTYYQTFSESSQNSIIAHNFNVGGVDYKDSDLKAQITSEYSNLWEGNIGLMSASDFINANSNILECGSYALSSNNSDICKSTNYLIDGERMWTISPDNDSDSIVNFITSSSLNTDYVDSYYNIKPVVYLKNDIKITEGTGSLEDYYILEGNLSKPTFKESDNSYNDIIVTYPEGANLTYEYKINDGDFIKGEQTQLISVTNNSTIVAKVSDGETTETSTYTAIVETDIGGNTIKLVKTGDGLTKDRYESGKYIYRGSNPDNYIQFNGEQWRIISKEVDGTYKIIGTNVIENIAFDSLGARTLGYCGQGEALSHGCNAWAASSHYSNGTYSGEVEKDAELNTYLNNDYYNTIMEVNRNQIVSHEFNSGPILYGHGTLSKQISEEESVKWTGNIGLISLSEYIRANSNEELCGNINLINDYPADCILSNWMHINDYYWTISSDTDDSSIVWTIYRSGEIYDFSAHDDSNNALPALYLQDNLTFTGSGTSTDNFIIN